MASLDLSQEGHAISKAIKTIVDNPPPGGSPTTASWVVLSVHNPLRNAFGSNVGGNKPSVLKVQATGEGEMDELFDEFNDGRVQFAMLKVKDANTQLGKNVFIAWCGEGVPEYVKGNYPSHLSHVSKNLFTGNNSYHVQINARSTSDLDPSAIVEKVANASGSKYSSASVTETISSTKPKPAAPAVGAKPAWKPGQAYTPTRSSGTHNPSPYASRGRQQGAQPVGNIDQDGWGEDAPQVSRNTLEKVGGSYQPVKVNMKELMKGKSDTTSGGFERPEPVKGAYQPVGKVDIAALRAQGDKRFDHKPEVIKGAYQPIGKVDIAAIRASAQNKEPVNRPTPSAPSRGQGQEEEEAPKSLSERSAAFNKPAESQRLTSLPKPKPAKAFGSGAAFTGTKPPTPGNFGPSPTSAPVGTASKDFASQGGKTPAQIWQEKKNRERGSISESEAAPQSLASQQTQAQETEEGPGVSAFRDRFKGMPMPSAGGMPPVAARQPSPPPVPALDMSTKPGAYDEREPSPSPPGSPARIAMPVARGQAPREPSPEPQQPPRPRSPSPAPARAAAVGAAAVASVAVGAGAMAAAHHAGGGDDDASGLTGHRARILYDYEKAEDNEIDLVEGELVGMIEMVDEDWWSGTNERGETGLFPSNYVELIEGGDDDAGQAPAAAMHHQEQEPEPEYQHEEAHHQQQHEEEEQQQGGEEGHTAVASYEYEAAEDNELSFPEGATITDVQFPDDDWWFGHYGGKEGLFPANYVELQQ